MPWHPPIPAEKLYSQPARDIGPALALLAYCYDAVGRDGWVGVQLKDIAVEFGIDYATVKRWWGAIRKGPFFRVQEDHGKKGWRVQFSDEWLDWHTIQANTEGANMRLDTPPSSPNEGADLRLNGAQVQIKSKSSPNESADLRLERNAYKVLIDSDQAVSESEDQDRTARALAHPAMKALVASFPTITLDAKQIQEICSTATDGAVWRSVIELFALNGWQPLIGNMLDRYRKALEKQTPTNGAVPARQERAGPVYRSVHDVVGGKKP